VKLRLRDVLRLAVTATGRRRIAVGLRAIVEPALDRLATRRRRRGLVSTRVVAVVGSFGKSTTVRAVSAAMGLDFERIDGNAGAAPALELLRAPRRARRVVLEIGVNRPGTMRSRALMLRPDVVVVTSVGSEHNRSLGNLEKTRFEKAEMVRGLSPTGVAVLNADDPNVHWMAGQAPGRVVLVGTSSDAELRAEDIVVDFPSGTRFALVAKGSRRQVKTRLLGSKAVFSILAAIAVGVVEGESLDVVIERLEELPPLRMRLEPVLLPDGTVILRDEFKSAPETIHNALDLLAEVRGRRKIVVLGEVSEPPGSQRPIYRAVGERAAQVADLFVHVGHSRQKYTTGWTRAGMTRETILDAGPGVIRAAEIVRSIRRPGDVILLKGRDTQKLDRVAVALMGREVRCAVEFCNLNLGPCDTCSYLTRGFPDNVVRM